MPSSSSPSCCPKGSEPFAQSPDNYKPIGKIIQLDGGDSSSPIPTYIVGNSSSKKCLLILSDVYGIHSGRHKVIADQLAIQCGYLIVMPDVFRGTPPFTETIDPVVGSTNLIRNYNYQVLKHDLLNIIYPYCQTGSNTSPTSGSTQNKQNRDVAVLGFCYGAYLWTFMAMDVAFTCCISPHPSIVKLAQGTGEDWNIAFSTINTPILLINAEGDAEEQMPNGTISELMSTRQPAAQSEYHCFNMVKHGWSVRGDLSNSIIREATQECFEVIIEFLKKHH